jgi:hypothetical protein
MKQLCWVLASLLVACQRPAPPAPTRAEVRNNTFLLEATAIDPVEGPAIAFTLRYLGSEPLSIYPFELPWGNPNSIDVWARTSDGQPLQTYFPIADPGPETALHLQSGAVREGIFRLSWRVNGVPEALNTSGVVVTWQYPLHPRPGSTPLTGRILFSKRDHPRKEPGAA